MRRYRVIVAAAGLLLLLAAIQCGDNKTGFQSGTKVKVSGQVGALPDSLPADGYVTPEPYSVLTGRPAYLDFEKINETEPTANVPSTQTDASSNFSIDLDPGWYRVVVNTSHSFPTFFDSVHVEKDTTLNFVVEMSFDRIDSVTIFFNYIYGPDDPPITPLTQDQEHAIIGQLNSAIGSMLDTAGMRTDGLDVFEPMHGYADFYFIPIRDGWLTWEAYLAVSVELRYPGANYPASMNLQAYSADGLDPDDFWMDGDWMWGDSTGGGAYTPPEPIINLWPDTDSSRIFDWGDSSWFRWNEDSL